MEKETPAETPLVRSWHRHARRNVFFLLFASLNLIWSIRLGIWWLILTNIGCVAVLTWNVFTALKWYHAYREGGERLRHLIEELFR